MSRVCLNYERFGWILLFFVCLKTHMAAAHITGTRKENQRNLSGGTLAVSTEVLIDIEKKLSEGKDKSYEQWAKVFNIKQMVNALLILREEGIGSTGIRTTKVQIFHDTMRGSVL